MYFYDGFRITGEANKIVYADALQSTDAEKKRLVALGIQMDAYAGTDDNDVQLFHERAEVVDIPEKMFGQNAAATTSEQAGSERIPELPIGLDIPVGESVKAALKCAATAVNLRGYYKYELIT